MMNKLLLILSIHFIQLYLFPILLVDSFHTSNRFLNQRLLFKSTIKMNNNDIEDKKDIASQRIIHGGFNHVGIIVKDNQKSKDFLIELFDLIDETHLRPNLPFPGSYLRFGNHQIHLMELPNPDNIESRPDYPGRDRHLAMWVQNIDIISARLDMKNIPYKMSSSGRRSLFVRDLDGNSYEFTENPELVV